MFIDRAEIYVCAGKGGDGCLSFRREKFVPRGGPDGGDGGDGGGVYVESTPGIETLLDFSHRHHWIAGNGQPGMGKDCHGKKGKPLILKLPTGTLLYDRDTGVLIKDLSEPGERICLATPGRGGRGNARFARATHQTPYEFEKGTPGQERWVRLELKLIADVGLVGMPNAGKSTLLSRLSKAHPKIADYPFTTLRPHLGFVQLSGDRRFVMADIPGLIEGAHEGAGLGHDFLRHVQRTRVLVHLVDVGAAFDQTPSEAYRLIRNELRQYSDELAAKEEILVANKVDLTDGREAAEELGREIGKPVTVISAVTGEGLPEMMEKLWTILEKHKKTEEPEPAEPLPRPPHCEDPDDRPRTQV